jgi:hypothetical protein
MYNNGTIVYFSCGEGYRRLTWIIKCHRTRHTHMQVKLHKKSTSKADEIWIRSTDYININIQL